MNTKTIPKYKAQVSSFEKLEYNTPQYYGDILEFMKVTSVDSDKEIDLLSKINPCSNCKGEVSYDEIYETDAGDLKTMLKVPAYTCKGCSQVIFSPLSFRKLIEGGDAADGKPFLKTKVNNGIAFKYPLH